MADISKTNPCELCHSEGFASGVVVYLGLAGFNDKSVNMMIMAEKALQCDALYPVGHLYGAPFHPSFWPSRLRVAVEANPRLLELQ